jgi:hypothetical protein
MKMTKDEIRDLKKQHRLELVMQETGEVFDSSMPSQWQSTSTPGLTVDLSRQLYDIKQPGKNDSGDVIGWLRYRYSWTFEQAIRFLRNRPADPERIEQPKALKAKKEKVMINTVGEMEPVDHWQKKALQIGGESIRKYFSWSTWDFALSGEEIRIDPVIAPQITRCQHCDKRFDWLGTLDQNVDLVPQLFGYEVEHAMSIPIIAYSIKHRLKIDLGQVKQADVQDTFNELSALLDGVFVEDDHGIVCVDCAAKEAKFYAAVSMCERSARIREQDEDAHCVTAGRGGAHK